MPWLGSTGTLAMPQLCFLTVRHFVLPTVKRYEMNISPFLGKKIKSFPILSRKLKLSSLLLAIFLLQICNMISSKCFYFSSMQFALLSGDYEDFRKSD